MMNDDHAMSQLMENIKWRFAILKQIKSKYVCSKGQAYDGDERPVLLSHSVRRWYGTHAIYF